jgi:leucyl aminopeptidase
MDINITISKHVKGSKTITVSSTHGNGNADITIQNFIDIWEAGKYLQTQTDVTHITLDISNLYPQFRIGFLNRAIQGLYTFDKYQTTPRAARKITIYDPRLSTRLQKSLLAKLKIANEVRDIANEPSNLSTPQQFCELARTCLRDIPHISFTEFDETTIVKKGLGLVNAVGKGSSRFLIVDYTPPPQSSPPKCICLLGKGVTFDTGGYSLKTKKEIQGMHLDDTGASIVVGIIKYLASSGTKCRIVGVMPIVENIITEGATKPGDIIKAYNGKTVEIIDTDAEGRLILADALAYTCKNYKPDYILDFATLTSWSAKLHCHTSYTYFTLDESISKKIMKIGEDAAERSMRIPPWIEYMDYARSDVADLKNYGFRNCENSDGFMATMFMLHFIPKSLQTKWVHFDIKEVSIHPTLGMADGFMSGVALVMELIT